MKSGRFHTEDVEEVTGAMVTTGAGAAGGSAVAASNDPHVVPSSASAMRRTEVAWKAGVLTDALVRVELEDVPPAF